MGRTVTAKTPDASRFAWGFFGRAEKPRSSAGKMSAATTPADNSKAYLHTRNRPPYIHGLVRHSNRISKKQSARETRLTMIL